MSYNKKYKVQRDKKNKKRYPYDIQPENIYTPLFYDMTLQRTIGNQEVQRLYKAGEILAKLFVNQPGDVYEQEADRIAQKIVTMGDKEVQLETSEIKVQKKGSSLGGESISSQTEAKINSIKGKGQPLGPKIRDYFQPRFGVDLKDVRVHTDSNADRLARAIRARAFTLGNDVVFAKGEYKPETKEGKKLVAHELTHVMQQNGGQYVQRDGGATAIVIIGIIGSVASVVGVITSLPWKGSQMVGEIRYPGEAIIPRDLLTQPPENQYYTWDIAQYGYGIITPLDIEMEAYVEYDGYDPITVNMGVRFKDEESSKPEFWVVASRVYMENETNRRPNIKIENYEGEVFFRKRRITFRTTVDTLADQDYIHDMAVELDPFAGLRFDRSKIDFFEAGPIDWDYPGTRIDL